MGNRISARIQIKISLPEEVREMAESSDAATSSGIFWEQDPRHFSNSKTAEANRSILVSLGKLSKRGGEQIEMGRSRSQDRWERK